MVRSGGKRLRPAFCHWGFVGAGGDPDDRARRRRRRGVRADARLRPVPRRRDGRLGQPPRRPDHARRVRRRARPGDVGRRVAAVRRGRGDPGRRPRLRARRPAADRRPDRRCGSCGTSCASSSTSGSSSTSSARCSASGASTRPSASPATRAASTRSSGRSTSAPLLAAPERRAELLPGAQRLRPAARRRLPDARRRDRRLRRHRRSPASRSATTCARASRRRCWRGPWRSPTPTSAACSTGSGAPGLDDDEVAAIQEVIVDTGALDALEARIAELAAEAVAALDEVDITAEARCRAHRAGRVRRRPGACTMRVVVVGAGLGGLAAAAHLVGDGHDVTVVERGDRPGGRAGARRARRLPARHRADRADDARTCSPTCSPPPAPSMADHVDLRPGRPDVPGDVRRRLGAPRPPRPGGDDRGDPRPSPGPRRRRRSSASPTGSPSCTASRCRTSSTPTSTRPSTSCAAGGPASRLVRLGGFGRLGRKVASFFDDERLQRIFSFQAMYAGVAPYEALALYAVITYMDSIEGVFVPAGRHARHVHRRSPTPSPRPGRRSATTSPVDARSCATATAPSRGVELAGGERLAADAVVCNADLPVAYRTLLGGVDAPRAARRGRYSPSCLLWVAGVRGGPPRRRRPPQHPLRRAVGRLVPGAHRRRRADARPVDPRHAALARRPVAGPARLLDAVRPRAGAQPRRPRRLDARTRDAGRRAPAPPGRRRRVPDRRRHRGGLRPARLGGDGDGAGHAVRPRPHVPPDRTVPPAQRRQAGAGPGVRRLVDRAGRRRADGARVGQARRGPRAARWGRR